MPLDKGPFGEQREKLMERPSTAQFDAVAEDYDDNLQDLLGIWGGQCEKFAEYKIQLVRKLLPFRIPSFLDFGCGIGRSLQYVKQYFPEIEDLSGCDVSQESLKIAAELFPEAQLFLNSPIEQLEKFEKTWSVVFLACVLHHIEPQERLVWMRELARHISPGGYIAIFEHNLQNPYTKRIVQDPLNRVDRIENMLSIEEVVALLKKADPALQVTWKGYTLFSPIRFPGVLTLEMCLRRIPLGAQHCVLLKKDS